MKAKLICVTPPTEAQLEGFKTFVMRESGDSEAVIDVLLDETLGSGFILRFDTKEYDWSERGRLAQFKEKLGKGLGGTEKELRKPADVLSGLRANVEEFKLEAFAREAGTVDRVGDGIAFISGINHVQYGEIVVFDCGVKGMILDIRADEVCAVLFGRDTKVGAGSSVVRTGKMAGISVGEGYLGRVVDALGNPLDGEEEITSEYFLPMERPAPTIKDRQPVSKPLETGILAIDSMFPIGRGQRELIIGDRQTGKTSIAIDTIINQKGKDVICVYVAIGQKASTIARLTETLRKHDAMDYTCIVASTASDPAPLQYAAPYCGTALAEYFMQQGKDVLIVYDDLSKHAVAYRAISLLLERSPGREAYPGDVFYLHSRLLERSARLSEELGGGSITALPIIETQAGDVSAYIPTNVISITDGQIFLESELFHAGQRPAVNVGLSVSRVGGAAQTKAMKKAAGTIRIDLAQYREMEVFTQFSSDLDSETKKQLAHGKSLMELLKQPLTSPLSVPCQIALLVASGRHLFAELPPSEVRPAKTAYLEYMEQYHGDLLNLLETSGKMSDDLRESLEKAAEEFFKWRRQEKSKTV
ncbi:MAG: F0F1 ATP synthase subunit alpha [Lachnospiraceae bacterium]|nr:F0F1 ATP synthase subunit alpha [Lachnospiraceae bacterium]